MTPQPLYIHNALLVDATHDQPRAGSVLVADGHIVALYPDSSPPSTIPDTAQHINAQGKWLAPGIIDLSVFATDKPAFHFGGITRAGLMPDGERPCDDPGLVERAAKAGKPDLWVHPFAAATRNLAGKDLAELALMRQAGARAVATGRQRIADSGVMYRLLSYAAALDMTVITHAEDEGLNAGAVASDGEMATRLGLASAPAIAEAIAVARDLMLAEESGATIHFRQITTAAALDHLRLAKQRNLAVTCAITPAHLLLSDIAIADFRTFARLSPPLRNESDRLACLQALRAGEIDILTSGHDPRGPENKRLPFNEAAPGMAGAETLLALSLILVREGYLSPGRLFDMLAATPARLLKVKAGLLESGYEADMILIDPEVPWQINSKRMAACAGNTPFDGLPVQGRVISLWKGGLQIR